MVDTTIEKYLESHKEEFKDWLEGDASGRIEIKILPYLKHIENGFFLEAGALDGLFMSNTKILEELGWKGLLIEPSKKAAESCKKNRTSAVERYALVSKEHEGDKVTGDFVLDGEFGIGAWSSINHKTYGQVADTIFSHFVTEVPAITLEKLLDKHGIKQIDFLSLDVEGYEMDVLGGIDFSKVVISNILIEVNLTDYSLPDLERYLSGFGYRNIGCLSNFSKEKNPGWNGQHQDYLFRLTK